ncbi:hypothetical protein [Actinomadura parmotrematis]|uniref:Uncharacterized protein n=1 Tax=Actinomadura parmotrematis TaxID=2864039 RepID=A0ABS7G4I2_9ACTN|nr:hypothetical protein [Actinomadura parmotrematis]MBW8487285.1 hypothetical protein [Actinomadura parmotrematis]
MNTTPPDQPDPTNPSNPPERSGTGHSGRAVTARSLLPLTVWLAADTSPTAPPASSSASPDGGPRGQGTARLCGLHQRAVGAELARQLITTCTAPGDVVAEGFTCSEATLIAAAQTGRRGVALVPHFPLAQHIGARLRATLPAEQLAAVAMRPTRPDQMARGLADHLGEVALVVAAPPPYEVGGQHSAKGGDLRCPACRAELWMLSHEQLALFLAGAWKVLRPGGTLAVITTARHEPTGRLADPAPRVIRQASLLGFHYIQHVIALRVPIDGDALVVQAGPDQIAELRPPHSPALPPIARVHADVCLFTKPATAGQQGDAR